MLSNQHATGQTEKNWLQISAILICNTNSTQFSPFYLTSNL